MRLFGLPLEITNDMYFVIYLYMASPSLIGRLVETVLHYGFNIVSRSLIGKLAKTVPHYGF